MISDKKRKLLEKSMCENSLLIMVGKSEILRNGDVFYPFRQDSDFLMLTGLNIPDLKLIAKKENGKVEWILYSDPISEKEKLWGTARLDSVELSLISGIMNIREMEQCRDDLQAMLLGTQNIYLRDEVSYNDEKIFLKKSHLSKYQEKIQSLSPFLRELRMYKMDEEIECIKKAVAITHDAYKIIEKNIRPGLFEYEIEAMIAGVFRSHHTVESYPTIVASGPNSCIMHYVQHTRRIQAGDQILIDFGAEYQGYSSDVTRVFFATEPSERQKQVYMSTKIVKNYAESIIPLHISRMSHEDAVRKFLVEELKGLGLIPLSLSEQEAKMLSKKYLPYRTLNHHLGLDTHDIGSKDDSIESGMVLTCEPGIYIPEEGIGVRLEDDIHITEMGYVNLSIQIPSDIFSKMSL